jgi:aryl-alcohol dehydrogenase-like predicted oxidoreductase
MALTGIYGPVDRQDAIAVVHRALDLGVVHFDTAELYGPYVNEELLADALRGKRPGVQIATKFGYRLEHGRIAGLDSRPEAIRRSVEGSLRRLRTEYIDVLYQHRIDPNVPIEDVVGTMAELVSEGKAICLGLSAVDATNFSAAHQRHPIQYVQNEYSLLERHVEDAVIPATKVHGTSLVAYSPLCRGILGGPRVSANGLALDDYRRTDSRFAEPHLKAAFDRLAPLWEIATQRDVSPSALALAWLLQRNPTLVVLPGARSPDQVTRNVHAANIALSEKEMNRLAAVST